MSNPSTRLDWRAALRARTTPGWFSLPWAQAMMIAVPWITVILLAMMLFMVHGKLIATPGITFDLPREPLRESANLELIALIMPVARDTGLNEEMLVFFDDARYSLGDDAQRSALEQRLAWHVSSQRRDALLLLADRRVPHGEVMRFVNLARGAGIAQIHVAEKTEM